MLPRPANGPIAAGLDHKHDLYPTERRKTPSSDVASVFKSLDRPFKLPMYPPPPSYAPLHADRKSPAGFPDTPKTELPPLKLKNGYYNEKKDNTLPSLSSLTVSSPKASYINPPPTTQAQTRPTIPPPPTYAPPPPPVQLQPTHWPSLNPYSAYYTPSHVEGKADPLRMEADSPSNSAISAASPETLDHDRSSSVSLDDPDVRLAAEALGDLRAGQYSRLLIAALPSVMVQYMLTIF
jgi:transcriptional repressor OPI1